MNSKSNPIKNGCKYFIIPSFSEDDYYKEIDYKDKLYNHNYMHTLLSECHHLFKPVKMKNIEIEWIRDGTIQTYPENPAFLEVLDLLYDPQFAPSESIESLKKDLVKSLENIAIYEDKRSKIAHRSRTLVANVSTIAPVQQRLIRYFRKEIINRYKSNKVRRITLPVIEYNKPLFDISNLRKSFNEKTFWLEEIIDLLKYLTEHNLIFAENISIYDFLFDESGKIISFIGSGKLKATVLPDMRIVDENILQLKLLFDGMIEKVPQIFQGNVIKVYNKIYNKGNDTSSGVPYNSFKEIIEDLRGQSTKKRERKKIAVFLDHANLFNSFSSMRPDLRLLFSKIFGQYDASRIQKKEAVLFKPKYETEHLSRRHEKYMEDATEYLHQYGFEVLIAENDSIHAKKIIRGKEYDADDMMLIDSIKESYLRYDIILIMSGDGHFMNIANQIKDSHRDVIFVSSIRESTNKKILDNFRTYLFEEYIDCFITE